MAKKKATMKISATMPSTTGNNGFRAAAKKGVAPTKASKQATSTEKGKS